MKFDKHFPIEQLKSYIKYFVVSENELENEYKVFDFKYFYCNDEKQFLIIMNFYETHKVSELASQKGKI
jgi:hypothetical protein